MGESPSQYTVQTLGTEYVPDIDSTDSPSIGETHNLPSRSTRVVRLSTPAYSITQRDDYYDEAVPENLNEDDESFEPIVLIDLPFMAPVATDATSITSSSFYANWTNEEDNVITYYLDVSTSSTFATFVSGYKNLNVGHVLTYQVTGLSAETVYYFRVRSATNILLSVNSNSTSCTTSVTIDDWFLPSKDGLNEMYTNLYLEGVGNFSGEYWSSSESGIDTAWTHNFDNGTQYSEDKNEKYFVRACRSFTAVVGAYSLRDVGPSGGLIFYIDGAGTTYLEAAPSDQSASQAWSNIYTEIGTTGTAIGTGQANTNAIIGQAEHTTSAAKLCDDLII